MVAAILVEIGDEQQRWRAPEVVQSGDAAKKALGETEAQGCKEVTGTTATSAERSGETEAHGSAHP